MCRVRRKNGKYDYVKRDKLAELIAIGEVIEVLS